MKFAVVQSKPSCSLGCFELDWRAFLSRAREYLLTLVTKCFFFSFVSVQIVLSSVPHKCHNSVYANMMLFYFSVFQCLVLFMSELSCIQCVSVPRCF